MTDSITNENYEENNEHEQENHEHNSNKDTNKIKKRFADAQGPVFAAVVDSLYRFTSLEQAQEKLAGLREQYITSKQQATNKPAEVQEGEEVVEVIDPNSAVFWVRNYQVNEAEIAEGRIGNFAEIRTHVIPQGGFTLNARKIDVAARFHPQRKRDKQKYPDWGHPFFRALKKGKHYNNLEEALAALQRLQMEYPDVSIPGQNKLFIMIYGRQKEEGAKPISKYVLNIKTAPQGGYFIECTVNTHQKKEKVSTALPSLDGEPVAAVDKIKQQEGYFSSMVQLKRKRRVVAKPTMTPPTNSGEA